MQDKKKKKKEEVAPKGGKTRIGTPAPSRSQSPFVAQGNQGATFDKIMREKYDWWR